MKKYKYLSYIFIGFAILLSDIMCARVAYNYCNMQWGIRFAGFSAPPGVAFLLIIPYAAGIVICTVSGWFFPRKYRKSV